MAAITIILLCTLYLNHSFACVAFPPGACCCACNFTHPCSLFVVFMGGNPSLWLLLSTHDGKGSTFQTLTPRVCVCVFVCLLGSNNSWCEAAWLIQADRKIVRIITGFMEIYFAVMCSVNSILHYIYICGTFSHRHRLLSAGVDRHLLKHEFYYFNICYLFLSRGSIPVFVFITDQQRRKGRERMSKTELVHGSFAVSLLWCEECKQQNKIPEYIKTKHRPTPCPPPSSTLPAHHHRNVKQIRTKPCEIEIRLSLHRPWN